MVEQPVKQDKHKPAKVHTVYGWAEVESEEEYFRWLERWKEREAMNRKLESEYIRRK